MDLLENIRKYKLLLASASPRRRELLAKLGVEFEICAGKEVDESYPDDVKIEDVAQYLARKKTEAYIEGLGDDEIVITADTIVVYDGKVMGKPSDEIEAKTMLSSLSGHKHKVIHNAEGWVVAVWQWGHR